MNKKLFGLGLRHKHHNHVLQNKPKVDFFEVHTENFISGGGASIDFLSKISANYPLSFHCVGLSIGSASGLDKQHLKNVKNLLDKFNPILFSDHLSWSSSKNGTSNDLLPIPYTAGALKVFSDNVKHAQNFFGRQILIENPSAYLEFEDSKMSEIDFLNEVVKRSGCAILLDINNVYVSSKNFKFDAAKYLNQIDISKIKEIHLAGHSVVKYQNEEIRIDTHSTYICDEVLNIYRNFIQKNKLNVPTLVEWDEEIPEFEVLYSEMKKVRELK